MSFFTWHRRKPKETLNSIIDMAIESSDGSEVSYFTELLLLAIAYKVRLVEIDEERILELCCSGERSLRELYDKYCTLFHLNQPL